MTKRQEIEVLKGKNDALEKRVLKLEMKCDLLTKALIITNESIKEKENEQMQTSN